MVYQVWNRSPTLDRKVNVEQYISERIRIECLNVLDKDVASDSPYVDTLSFEKRDSYEESH